MFVDPLSRLIGAVWTVYPQISIINGFVTGLAPLRTVVPRIFFYKLLNIVLSLEASVLIIK